MNWRVWSNLTFKTLSYRKNFDMLIENENIITEHSGTISILNIAEHKPPRIIGEYGFSVWNISLSKILKISLNKLLKYSKSENTYDELNGLIRDKLFNFKEYNRVMFIHNLVLHPDFRKFEICEEFMEFIYRDFYSEDIAIIALVMPFQNNKIDFEYYFKHKTVKVKSKLSDSNDDESVIASKYYSLDELLKNEDTEMNEYKLFSIASRCGFQRLGESHLFQFNPEFIINRLKEKSVEIEKITIYT